MAALSQSIANSEITYKRRVWAWTMYDWANSAFATTILAAVLPIYFSQEAGATLPSEAVATSYWSYGLSISLLIIAILAPILGTISDVMRGKKRFLAVFAGLGIVSTALLVFVGTGDWILASILAILGRIGFNGANSFYDALLPHVARSDDQDRVSTLGYAMGYLGGGILLLVNILMIFYLPGTWGARLSFLSVAIWWAAFSIPLFILIPEPPAAPVTHEAGQGILAVSFKRIRDTLRDIQQYRELFKFLVAFLIYNDGIGTIIGVAAIYGSELGFATIELILALLLVQFVGIPYSLVFGRLPSANNPHRPFFLAFVLFNLFALPATGILAARLLPANISGAPLPRFENTAASFGEGIYSVSQSEINLQGSWTQTQIPASVLGGESKVYADSVEPGAYLEFPFNGQKFSLLHSAGPDHGIWAVEIDGAPLLDEDTGEPVVIDAYSPTLRYEVRFSGQTDMPGEHVLRIRSTGERSPNSQGIRLSLATVEVLPGIRQSNLLMVIGLIVVVELVGLLLAWLTGKPLFGRLANRLDTQRSVLLALVMYAMIAVWGFFLDSVVEFWFLAWMVSIVQGGSQALSRSLYAGMSPASKSGEFFGLFGIMEKFSAIIGPLLFGLAGSLFGSSRPAVLSLIVLFILGGYLLMRVDVEAGRKAAQAEDQTLMAGNPAGNPAGSEAG
jgi:UMF1 family MFS transporter